MAEKTKALTSKEVEEIVEARLSTEVDNLLRIISSLEDDLYRLKNTINSISFNQKKILHRFSEQDALTTRDT
jgi:hypothetical protein